MRSLSFAGLIGDPCFSFVRARGYSIEDAQDLTQDFFVTILKNNWLQHADRNRGRFRSLLLKSLQNFLINAAEEKSCTQTRRRRGICFLGRVDGGSAIAIIDFGSSARLLATGAHLRSYVGRRR